MASRILGVGLILAVGGSALSGLDEETVTKLVSRNGGEDTEAFFNYGLKRSGSNSSHYRQDYLENTDRVLRSKVNVLARLLKIHVDRLRDNNDQVELVFLVDSSASVGDENFRSELNFVRKLLSDFTVEPSATRVALVTFAGKKHIRRHIDQISSSRESDHKCYLLNKQLENITYTGGGTYTRGALLEALDILKNSRNASEKVVFLITDGFSNSGDPRPAAKRLKDIGATIFTFGIRTGNVEELHDIASSPGYTHSYLLDSFAEFEALARRALHRDLKAGRYIPVELASDCDDLCALFNETSKSNETCCDKMATCACGSATGHYACLCPRGYFGSGLAGFCQPCPNGTFDEGGAPADSSTRCTPCPNVNHVTVRLPATSVEDCVCAPGFVTDGDYCEAIRCPKLTVPENGYFVKASACSNVVNAACGLRCRIGFQLIGDSIRLCRKDGVWSGVEPQCLLKTCAALRAPAYGRIRCEHEEMKKKIEAEDPSAYPIDTRCQFRCDLGYQLRGSKVRNCLPLSRWDGLKVTCKQIKCEPLNPLTNGKISPENCTGSSKLPFSTNCTFSCDEGYVLKGPKVKHCSGKSGVWSQRHSINQCVDKTPPTITCPENSTWSTAPGKSYALVKWKTPLAEDNSGKPPDIWSKPHLTLPWKAKLGVHKIVYVAQDPSGNQARCKFLVKVVDEEPPSVENCADPSIFLTAQPKERQMVSWTEPTFHDNSEVVLTVKKSHETPECNCSLGTTQISYNATDASGNFALCVLNVTIEDACKNLPVVSNGQATCETLQGRGVQCLVSCEEGYGFALEQTDALDPGNGILLTCGLDETPWNGSTLPDCSATEVPTSVSRDGSVVLKGNASFCDNSTMLNELDERITGDLESNILEACGNDIDCTLVNLSEPNCEEIQEEDEEWRAKRRRRRSRLSREASKVEDKAKSKNMNRSKRKRAKIEIKFRFVGKIVAQYRNDPELGIKKLREKLQAMTESGQLNLLNNKTSHEIAKLALNLNTVFKDARELCEPGRVLKRHNCTKCPMGTFHNQTRDQCQACRFGEYQNSTGTTKCLKCPEHMFTRKMHTKKLSNCISVCRPGFFSFRKPNQVSKIGLEPCISCEKGFYQSEYGKMSCLKCPENETTLSRASSKLEDCLPVERTKDPCLESPCLNGGSCSSENDSFSCECPEDYVGSLCEIWQNPCESLPCMNDGMCSLLTGSEEKKKLSFSCSCRAEFTGKMCETYIDECVNNPCQNGASCLSNEKDYSCVCKNGFEGDFCENAVDHCESRICEGGSTCITVDGTWRCLCKPGYLGLRCNLLPCDWIPCPPNFICLNQELINATRNSYSCVCPAGFEGPDCSTRIDHCRHLPCLNGGSCLNNLLNHTCECRKTFTGPNCETKLSSDYVLHFSKVGTSDYVIMKGPKRNLRALTVCLWLQSVDTFNYGTVLSYATKKQDNAFTLTDYNGFVVYVNGQKVVTDITVNDGHWHFLCVDWESSEGSWHAYVDGILRDNGTHLSRGSQLDSEGLMVVGQEQDYLGGGFSASEAFLGKLGYLDLWQEVLGPTVVENLSRSCEDYHGSLVAWAEMREHIKGTLLVIESLFCRGCESPSVPAKGRMDLSEDGSEAIYSCEAGYSVRVGNWVGRRYGRRCLKHGRWEGYLEPRCTKVKCGVPSYFPRGRIQGRSFTYGDEIKYSCMEGYELKGHPRRVCNADGTWSGTQPICIGITCKNLLAPENGDIEYVIEDHERDDLSILQVGQQLEFKCEPGFQLVGQRYLTCVDTGKWDFERPSCAASGCLAPKLLQHGYISTNQFAILPIYDKTRSTTPPTSSSESGSSVYSFGDVVGLSCHEGFKFRGNRNLLVEFRVQCSENGTWTGHVPDCVRLRCPSPKNTKNGRYMVDFEDGTRLELVSGGPELLEDEERLFSEGIDAQSTSNRSEEARVDETLVPGSKISLICDPGFELRGQETRTCQADETWSSEEPICSRIKCSRDSHPVLRLLKPEVEGNSTEEEEENLLFEGKIAGALFEVQGGSYGDKVVLKCEGEHSFFVLGDIGLEEESKNVSWLCQEDGEWRTEAAGLNETVLQRILEQTDELCQRISCGAPQVPINGYIVNASDSSEELVTRSPVNSSVSFGCRSGFELEGQGTAQCLLDGNWSTIPSCGPVSCKPPPKLPNALLEESSVKSEYTFGNTIAYKCSVGYRIFGQASARCLATGKWSKMHGKCSKISCGKPKIAPGATIYGRSYLFQEQLTYKCPRGGPKGTIICKSDGKWSEPPLCTTERRR